MRFEVISLPSAKKEGWEKVNYIGVMEWWSIGELEKTHYSSTPLFQHSLVKLDRYSKLTMH